ncbi:FAD binding domain-containing protein [Diaporthe sp. PMI_573]|nr:FAD binding domain-containing protein [Diaporthaceae sp. PMI_573]
MAPPSATGVADTTEQTANGSSGVPKPRCLPPGFTDAKFSDFLSTLYSLVGKSNIAVITSETVFDDGDYETVDCLTHDMHNFYDHEEFIGSALVRPRHVQDVQAIVKLCNDFAAPLWVFSKGHNLGYGGAAPRVSGSLVMDLGKHMNKVLEVNAVDCYCLLEPGVSYLQLQEYLREHKLDDKVMMDAPELGYGSVIGNALDHGVGFTPYGDHWMMHCGIEIVLPTGEIVRTGMGAMSSPEGREQAKQGVHPADQKPNECWQLFPYGFGPVNDGIFSQAGNGIVTKMGMWLMPRPPGMEAFMVTYEKDEDLPQIIDIIGPLRVNMILQNAAALRHVGLDLAHYNPRSHYTDKALDEPLTDEDLDRGAKQLDLGRWVYMGTVYGPPVIREAHLKIIKQEMLKCRAHTMRGVANMDELGWLQTWIPNCSFMSLAPISKVSGESAWAQYVMAKKRFDEAKLDYMGIFSIGMREMHNVVCIVFDRKDPDVRRRVQWLVRTMIKDWAEHGWGEFRTHIGMMDQVANTYDFNDHALMKLNEKIKNALDPNGIMAPGKSGVWPQQYDKKKWALGEDYIK